MLFQGFLDESQTPLDVQARLQLKEYISNGDATIPEGLENHLAHGILRTLGIAIFDVPGGTYTQRQHPKQFLRLSENTLRLIVREAAREAGISEQVISDAIQL